MNLIPSSLVFLALLIPSAYAQNNITSETIKDTITGEFETGN
jgi:hypothetical protein